MKGKRGAAKRKPARKEAVPARTKRAGGADVPRMFRLNLEVGDLDAAATFYGTLFGVEGRRQAGARVYVAAGPVVLQVIDVSPKGRPHPAAKALYFTVADLGAIHARAKALDCLSDDDVHGARGGDVVVRPWGERSFYAEDPWGNPLCFVEEGTTYPG